MVEMVYDRGFSTTLEQLGLSIAVSTYKASKVFSLWGEGGKVVRHEASVPRAMGVGFEQDMMVVATQGGMSMYRRVGRFPGVKEADRNYDNVWVERAKYLTGPIDTHDVGIVDKRIFAVNTAWSCVGVFGFEESFQPIWKPPFVSKLGPGDRCHLNGMAMVDGVPKYVTALGQTDEPRLWKESIVDGGVLMDVESNEVLLEGLAMPHSPAWNEEEGCLYFLESAIGALSRYFPASGKHEIVMKTDRFVRGLAIHGDFAFMGFSKLRESSSTFRLLHGKLSGECAGVLAVDMASGKLLGVLEFEEGIDELYDVSFFPVEGRHIVLSEWDAKMQPHLVLQDKLIFLKRKEA